MDAQLVLLVITVYQVLNILCSLLVHQGRIVPRDLLKLLVRLEHRELLFSDKLKLIAAVVLLVHRVEVVQLLRRLVG